MRLLWAFGFPIVVCGFICWRIGHPFQETLDAAWIVGALGVKILMVSIGVFAGGFMALICGVVWLAGIDMLDRRPVCFRCTLEKRFRE